MAGLKDFPYKINTEALPFPTSWNISSKIIETVKQSEGGTDIVMVERRNKRSISVTLKLAGTAWVKKLMQFKDLDSLTVSQYNPVTETYEDMTMRMRNFNYSAVKNSEDLTAVTGIWDVSFSLEEY